MRSGEKKIRAYLSTKTIQSLPEIIDNIIEVWQKPDRIIAEIRRILGFTVDEIELHYSRKLRNEVFSTRVKMRCPACRGNGNSKSRICPVCKGKKGVTTVELENNGIRV